MPPDRHHQQRPQRAAQPTRPIFDPFNSSATGHQRAENRLAASVGWRESRTRKLAAQYGASSTGTGGPRMADTAGGGVQDAVVRTGWRSVADMLGGREEKACRFGRVEGYEEKEGEIKEPVRKGIFDGLGFYVNGSTAPVVGDQRLKGLIAENGGRVNVHLGRRAVTHVIVGRQNGASGNRGAGGGLAAGKLEREIRRVGGVGVKYVGVEWVLESIGAGKRLPEAGFVDLKIAMRGQKSVYGMFKQKEEIGEREK